MVAQTNYMSFLALTMSGALRTVAAAKSDQDRINDLLERQDELIAKVDEQSEKAVKEELKGGEECITGLIGLTGKNAFAACVTDYEVAFDPKTRYPSWCAHEEEGKRRRHRREAEKNLLKWIDCKHCGNFHTSDDVCKERFAKDTRFRRALDKYKKCLVTIRKLEKSIVEEGCQEGRYYYRSTARKEKDDEISELEETMQTICKEINLAKTHTIIARLSSDIEKQDKEIPTEEKAKQCIEFIKTQKDNTRHNYAVCGYRWTPRLKMYENLLARARTMNKQELPSYHKQYIEDIRTTGDHTNKISYYDGLNWDELEEVDQPSSD